MCIQSFPMKSEEKGASSSDRAREDEVIALIVPDTRGTSTWCSASPTLPYETQGLCWEEGNSDRKRKGDLVSMLCEFSWDRQPCKAEDTADSRLSPWESAEAHPWEGRGPGLGGFPTEITVPDSWPPSPSQPSSFLIAHLDFLWSEQHGKLRAIFL